MSEDPSRETQEAPATTTHRSREPVSLDPTGVARWLPPIALVLSVIAVGLAIWVLIEGPLSKSNSAPSPSAQQTADAKTKACKAYGVVRQAVHLQTNGNLGPDPVAQSAVAANARLSMSEGATYLLANLDPATPGDVAAAIRSFAGYLQDISMYAQANVSNSDPSQADRLKDGSAASDKVAALCK
ncbi:MAG TPA: hypothetical protein VFB19_00875 [Mycobacterium sp.]|nr:hypothetical protein [Mycobacterium sp.]